MAAMERMMDKQDEAALLRLLEQGDDQAFEVIVKRHSQDLLREACRLTKDVDSAKDLVQDVLVSLWERRGRLRIESSLFAYLRIMLKHRFLRQVARSNLHEEAMQHLLLRMDQMQSSILDMLAVADLEQSLSEIVDNLPVNMQKIFALRNEDYTLREIAEALGLAEQTVKSYHAELNKRIKIGLLGRHPDISHSLIAIFVYVLY